MKLDSADRKILFVALAIFVITLLLSAAVSPSADESLPYPSPTLATSGGAKAAYTLLHELGYSVEHWRQSPSKLLEHGINTVLIVAVPTQNPTPQDREDIRRYLESGGRILAIGMSSAAILPRNALFSDVPHFTWKSYPALLPTGITRNAPEIAMAPMIYWKGDDADVQVNYGDEKRGVVVSYRYGKGEVVWWAAADPLTNSGIMQKSNLQLFLNSLGPPGSRTVLWDDFFHEGEVTMMDSLLASPLKWSLLQLGLLALVVVFTYSRRHGPIRALPQPSRLATLEFVETLGALYQRAEASELPVQIAYERFRHLLHRNLGIAVAATPQQVAEHLQGRLAKLPLQCEQVLSTCETARYRQGIELQESLRLLKSLHELSEQLHLTSNQFPIPRRNE